MSTTTPNMSLTVPEVSVTPGPTYASEINTDLSTIDSHDHSLGKGVQITPSGLSINADLPFNENNAVSLRSARFTNQTNPIALGSDLNCAYSAGTGGDLYYNDGSGNQVRLTQGGNIAATAGSISGLTSPASASYSSPTFTFESDANVAANISMRSAILRNAGASSPGLTLSPPDAMSGDIAMKLPIIPATQSFLAMASSGDISCVASVSGGITKSMLAPLGQVTGTCAIQVAPAVGAIDGVCSTTIVTTGRPVMILVYGGVLGASNTTGSAASGDFFVIRSQATSNSITVINEQRMAIGGEKFSTIGSQGVSSPTAITLTQPTSIVAMDASAAASTWRYAFTVGTPSGLGVNNQAVANGAVNPIRISVYEL